MPSLNFTYKPELVKEGIKRQTIRPVQNREYKEGDILHLFKGLRTPNCEKLGVALCSEVFKIRMELSLSFPSIRVYDGTTLTKAEREDIAKRDGFENEEQMWLWFRHRYKCADWIFWVIRWHKPFLFHLPGEMRVRRPNELRKLLEEKAREEMT